MFAGSAKPTDYFPIAYKAVSKCLWFVFEHISGDGSARFIDLCLLENARHVRHMALSCHSGHTYSCPQVLTGDQETMMKKKQDESRLKIAVRVDPEDFAKLEELRIKEEKNVSAIIRRYIKEGLERDEKKK
jgi:hypothetical protein